MSDKPKARQLAKQGNKKAIIALVNHNLKSAKIQVKHLMIEDECLYIGLEGEKIEPKEKIASFMEKFLSRLAIDSVKKSRVFGYKLEANEATWREEIELHKPVASPKSREEVKTLKNQSTLVNQAKSPQNFPTTYPPSSGRYNSDSIQTQEIIEKNDKRIEFKDCFDVFTIALTILYLPGWFSILFSLFISPTVASFLTTIIIFGTSLSCGYLAYTKKRNMVRWFHFNFFPGFIFFGIPLLLGVTDYNWKEISRKIIAEKEPKKITWKVSSDRKRLEFIKQCIERCFIRTFDPKPDYYYFHVPTKVYKLRYNQSNNLPYVEINLTYFSLIDGDFEQDKKKITYDLKELYDIFWGSFNGQSTTMFVSWGANKLILLPEGDHRIDQLKSLCKISNELGQIKRDRSKLDREISKTTSLIKTLEMSNSYSNKVDSYKQGLKLLEESKQKAKFVTEEYKKFLKEYILDFYIADVEPNISEVEHKSIDWMGRYEFFQEDYMMLKTMMEEYEKLKQGDYT